VSADEVTVEALVRRAWEAREHALPVLSGYRVGAAILAGTGRVFGGCNIETGTAKVCLCAEVCALYKALSEGEREFMLLAVVAERPEPIVPCGHCRQVLMEYAPGVRVVSENERRERREWRLADLLPEAYRFEPRRSGRSEP
jgi:cytidine deaminase